MLQDTDMFDKLEGWLTMGDVLPTVDWHESVSPDERYEVNVLWRFRNARVGEAQFFIEPILNSDEYRIYWVNLRFIEEWQNKGLYADIVGQLPAGMLPYGVVEVYATPWDKEAERRLAAEGFEWRGTEFVLDFRKVVLSPSDD